MVLEIQKNRVVQKGAYAPVNEPIETLVSNEVHSLRSPWFFPECLFSVLGPRPGHITFSSHGSVGSSGAAAIAQAFPGIEEMTGRLCPTGI